MFIVEKKIFIKINYLNNNYFLMKIKLNLYRFS